ncbi:MAG: flagellar motor switch protein FliM [Oscillospiraceae bacterium]|jgi:flagellar motor switch protein FliM|nr:flagellar motor switch protein FliM [Oscillospiraceae bacterium]
MPDNLSQSQIDELMKRMHSGDVDTEVEKKPKIKEYDFSSPKKFTKEQLKSLNGLHDNFARVLSSYFTSMLRDVCEVEVVQIEEERYFEFNNALPDSSLTGIIDFKPEDEQHYEETSLILDMSTSLGYLLVERMLGGTSHGSHTYIPQRDFTEIELTLLNGVFEQVTKYLQESWNSYVSVKTTLASIETNARLLQAFSPQDVVVIVAMSVKMDNYSGTITICLPAESIEEVVDSFKNRYSRTTKQQDPEKDREKREIIMDSIKKTDIEIKAVLDQFQMPLGEILQLQVQDVIALNKNINSDISVMVDDQLWYSAKLGVSKLKKSVKLIDVVAV